MSESGATENSATQPDDKKKYMYWIHCIRCFEIYIHKCKAFILLACHHIYCVDCAPIQPSTSASDGNIFNCLVCKTLVRGRELNNSLPQHIKEIFHPRPYSSELSNIRVVNFQQKMRMHLIANMTRIQRRIDKLNYNMELVRKNAKKNFEKLEATKNKRKQLERRVRKIIIAKKIREQKRQEREESLKEAQELAKAKANANESGMGASVRSEQVPLFIGCSQFSYPPKKSNLKRTRTMQEVRNFDVKRNRSFDL